MSLRPSVEWLLVLFPVAVVLKRVGAPAPLLFVVAALVVVPLAPLIVRSTEQVAEHTGPALGGLLNATFGNPLIGAILANVLLALGVAFLLGGRRHHVMDYNPAGARAYAELFAGRGDDHQD